MRASFVSAHVDRPDSFHPYECDGPGKCVHCDRRELENHHPDICALCDPEYDGMPNEYWPAAAAGEAAE